MAVFDQRGQHVIYQFNAAGDINFGAVQNRLEVIDQLEKLQTEVNKATEQGALDEEVAVDVEGKLKKAVIQAKKPEPDKKTILARLNEAKVLLEGVAAAGGMITALVQAAEAVQKFF